MSGCTNWRACFQCALSLQDEATFESVLDSSLYQKVDREIEIVVNKDKITLVSSAQKFKESGNTDWQNDTKTFFAEDDLENPKAGAEARLEVQQRIEREQVGGWCMAFATTIGWVSNQNCHKHTDFAPTFRVEPPSNLH